MQIDIKEKAKNLKERIAQSENIVIFGHVNPDGDAIGSSLGLYHYLKNKGKKPKVVMPNDFPVFLKWIPGAKEIIDFEKQKSVVNELLKAADIIFYCDFNDLKRIQARLEKDSGTFGYKSRN